MFTVVIVAFVFLILSSLLVKNRFRDDATKVTLIAFATVAGIVVGWALALIVPTEMKVKDVYTYYLDERKPLVVDQHYGVDDYIHNISFIEIGDKEVTFYNVEGKYITYIDTPPYWNQIILVTHYTPDKDDVWSIFSMQSDFSIYDISVDRNNLILNDNVKDRSNITAENKFE